MPNTNEQTVYSRAIAIELQLQGFKVIRIEKNPFNLKYDCYIFDRSPLFDLALSTVIAKRKNKEGQQ